MVFQYQSCIETYIVLIYNLYYNINELHPMEQIGKKVKNIFV